MNSIKMLLTQAEVYSKDLYKLTTLEFYNLVEKSCLNEPTCNEIVKDGKIQYVIYTFGDGCQVVLDNGILFHEEEDVQVYTNKQDVPVTPLSLFTSEYKTVLYKGVDIVVPVDTAYLLVDQRGYVYALKDHCGVTWDDSECCFKWDGYTYDSRTLVGKCAITSHESKYSLQKV